MPVTDQELINTILNVFHIAPFKEDETGTSIIIPYIDSKKLLEDIVPLESVFQMMFMSISCRFGEVILKSILKL